MFGGFAFGQPYWAQSSIFVTPSRPGVTAGYSAAGGQSDGDSVAAVVTDHGTYTGSRSTSSSVAGSRATVRSVPATASDGEDKMAALP